MDNPNHILVDLTLEEFEERRGKTFLTSGTSQSSALTKYPTHRDMDGKEWHSVISFESYEDYLEYNKYLL